MKAVTLYELPGLKSVEIIRAVLQQMPPPDPRMGGGGSVGEIRARCKVLDELDALPPGATSMLLEDDRHATLCRALNSFQFGLASKDLLKVIDGILETKAPVPRDVPETR